jgi:hypothetical protein
METKEPLLCERLPQRKNQSQNGNQKSRILKCNKASQNKGSRPSSLMSALGQKQTYAPQQAMSALPPKADMCGATSNVR